MVLSISFLFWHLSRKHKTDPQLQTGCEREEMLQQRAQQLLYSLQKLIVGFLVQGVSSHLFEESPAIRSHGTHR